MQAVDFFHSEEVYNLTSPKEIVPILVKIFQPGSVVDVGCGLGTFLYCFKEQGVGKVIGMDGQWVDKNLLEKYLKADEFIETDLRKPITYNEEKFDLAISLEVAEHLPEECADVFVASLTSLSDTIVFSAAIPNQGGQDHINEQWPSYWIPKFEKHGYVCHDMLRSYLWNNSKIFWWYKQNILIFSKDKSFNYSVDSTDTINLVHPDLFDAKSNTLDEISGKLNDIYKGRVSLLFVLKLFVKVCLEKIGVKNF